MNPVTPILVLVTAAFGAYSSWVMLQVGYVGIFDAGMANPAALQILLDLVIACLLLSSWMVVDARKSGRNPWPYVLITLVGGSFGPLLYLLVGRLAGSRATQYA